jgi:hypothetical protein
MPASRQLEYRAGQLAETLPPLGIGLPAQVRYAITAHEAAQRLRAPAPPLPGAATRAAGDAAIDLAHAACEKRGVLPPLDAGIARIGAARAAEQRTLDEAELVREVKAAAGLVLVQAVAAQAAKIVASLQTRHREVIAELVERARRLPPGINDQVALERGGEVREDYLAARDLAALAGRLRDSLSIVENDPPRSIDGLGICLMYERSSALYDHWLAPSGTTDLGTVGSFEFYLRAAHEAGLDWWLPSAAEWRQRCAEIVERHQADRARLAGAHVL